MHPAGSVAVLLNLDTTPVQLRTKLFQTGDPPGRGISSYLAWIRGRSVVGDRRV